MKPGYASNNFPWRELRCRCGCGTRNISKQAIAKLQAMRDAVGKPMYINCAARCPRNNVKVGGAPRSKHRSTPAIKSCAFDISLRGHNKSELIKHAEAAGFKGMGVKYNTFLHVDDRSNRARW